MSDARTSNLRWISWHQHGDDAYPERDPSCRPVKWPPPPEVLAFWKAGFSGSAGKEAYCTVIALVRSESEAASKATIEGAWPLGIGAWCFNREYSANSAMGTCDPPSDRFPPPAWSLAMDRWPWKKADKADPLDDGISGPLDGPWGD